MPTDTERREVARRLREIRPCKSGHIKWWKIARALGLKQPAGWFGWEKFEPDSANRLADLIEPSGMSQGCRDTVACDRDALLELANEMDQRQHDVATAATDGVVDAWCLREYARRIRGALGVES